MDFINGENRKKDFVKGEIIRRNLKMWKTGREI